MVERSPSSKDVRRERFPADGALGSLMEKSKFRRLDAENPNTRIERDGKQFSIEMIPDGKSETLSDVQNLFVKTFGAEEVDPEEILRAAVDGKTPWGDKDMTKYRVHVVKNERGEVISTVAGGRLKLKDGNGRPLGKQMFMVAYAVTDKDAREGGLATEAYISAIKQAAKEARAEGEELVFAAGEAKHTSEGFWNSVGWRRVYVETPGKPNSYEELRYVQPALDFDPATGEVAQGAGAAPEHIMIDSFESTPPDKTDILATVRAFYQWCNTWPKEAFENPRALKRHQEHVVGIWKDFKKQVENGGKLAYLDRRMREEMIKDGVTITGHAAADHGETGPEDF